MGFNQFSLFSTKRFLPLFITQFLGALNDNIFKNAIAILIAYRVTELAGMSAQLWVTLATGIFILPYFLFSATAGQLADKYDKAHFIMMTKLAEVIVMFLVALGFYFQNIPVLMVLLFLLGTQAAFFGPVKYAILPEQLHENELIAGNGLVEAGTFLAILIGTIVGGIFILHAWGSHFISFILCLFALGGFVSSLYIPRGNYTHTDIPINYNFITETFRVIQYSKEKPILFLCILSISWFWLVGAIFIAEFPIFTKNILFANEQVVTFFFALFSIGIAIGSLLCNKLLNGKVHATYVPWGALAITVFTIDLYFATKDGSVARSQLLTLNEFLQSFKGCRITLDLLFTAIGGGIYTVPLYAILLKKSPVAHRARIIASNNIMNALFMVLAALVTMLMLHVGFSVSEVFLFIAFLNGAFAIYIRGAFAGVKS